MHINAKLFIESCSIIENVINEYLGKEICIMGSRFDFIVLDKKECFNVSFHHGKLFSIFYQDDEKYSTIYTPFDGEKAQIIKSN